MKKNQPANYINDNEIKAYYLISFLFLNSFFAPVFRTALTYCNMKGEEYYSAYNNFITADAIYLKIIIFIYILFNINIIIININKLKAFNFFFIFLLLQSFITPDTSSQIINILNFFLFICFILFTVEKNYLSVFIKLLFFYLILIVGLSLLSLIFEDSFFVSKCYVGGNPTLGLIPVTLLDLNLAGLTYHKNALGLHIFILNFLSIYFSQYLKINKIIIFFILIISILGLLYIASITSLFMTLLITIAFLLKQNKKYFITALSIFFILLFFNVEDILNLFGRDMALSGRAFLWLDMFSQGISFPIIGKGLNNASLVMDSTYIEMIIETGFVFTLCYFIWILVQFFKNLYISKKINDSLIFLILIFYSIVESVGAIYSTTLLILVMLIVYLNKFIDKKPPEEY
tara:strand:+ start:439 stop:1647 length:1209 start_codon:yes stop_codon:yes gene_type:complete